MNKFLIFAVICQVAVAVYGQQLNNLPTTSSSTASTTGTGVSTVSGSVTTQQGSAPPQTTSFNAQGSGQINASAQAGQPAVVTQNGVAIPANSAAAAVPAAVAPTTGPAAAVPAAIPSRFGAPGTFIPGPAGLNPRPAGFPRVPGTPGVWRQGHFEGNHGESGHCGARAHAAKGQNNGHYNGQITYNGQQLYYPTL